MSITITTVPNSGGSGAPLSNSIPQPLGTASAGTSTAASRGDHVHPVPNLEAVVQAGNQSQTGIDIYTGDGTTAVAAFSDGVALTASSVGGTGAIISSDNQTGLQASSEAGVASKHRISALSTENISEFSVDETLVAAIKNDGRIMATPGVDPTDVATVSQLGVAPLTNILITNGGVTQGALGSNQTVNMTLTDASHTWSVAPLASKADASALDIVSGNRIRDAVDKNLNIIRVILEVSYTGGGSDGTLSLSLVNPSNVVIDQESEGINIDGAGATNQRIAARFFVVKTADNNVGYTLRISNGAKALTAYRVVSILRNNNP